jgi:uncharacterized protein YndB with AHSA1/START domain
MKIKETIKIAASAAEVWPFVAVPARMAGWNPKLVSVSRASEQPVILGERFSAVYVMSGKNRESDVEVTACEPAALVTYRNHFNSGNGRPSFVDESYTLSAQAGATVVEQVVDLSGAGIPLFWRAVIWFIGRFGKSVEEPYMLRLKRLVESDKQHT